MAEDWNERARANAMHFIVPRYGLEFSNAEQFYRDGAQEAITFFKPVLDEFHVNPSTSRLLEIGCGIGRMFVGYSELGFGDITGVDVSPEMIRLAKDLCPVKTAHFVEGNGRDLSAFEDQAFDYCFSYAVFQHIPDPEILSSYLRESHRVLKPGGILQAQFVKIGSLEAALLEVLKPLRPSLAELRRRIMQKLKTPPSESDRAQKTPGDYRTWMWNPVSPRLVTRTLSELGMVDLVVSPDNSHRRGTSFWIIGRKGP